MDTAVFILFLLVLFVVTCFLATIETVQPLTVKLQHLLDAALLSTPYLSLVHRRFHDMPFSKLAIIAGLWQDLSQEVRWTDCLPFAKNVWTAFGRIGYITIYQVSDNSYFFGEPFLRLRFLNQQALGTGTGARRAWVQTPEKDCDTSGYENPKLLRGRKGTYTSR